ncbi:Protein-disulfide isomerase [Faunimonas pinastri]|uniref:Protein-disulfide isomerase n=1 Tax=Faunimonas pinastri TaxID=1855383 RepID=A0A1H8ZR00_9HYPH|nr:DsbA family protein [Faunimonas pinastri]SEP66916.1 Protein-disulfide isomerase [Faunimonas pinastri]
MSFLHRRTLFAGCVLALGAVTSLVGPATAFAQGASTDAASGAATQAPGAAQGADAGQGGSDVVSTTALYSPSKLGDKVLGNADAKVTVIEYASMTCPHCGDFYRTTFDKFKEKYVDSGKVKFIFREFPLDAGAYAVAMLGRCAPADKFYEIVDLYFKKQKDWVVAKDPYSAIFDMAKPYGFTKESFDACLSNQALFDGMNAEKERASQNFGVSGTPTFFINGKRTVGEMTIEDLDKQIQPLLQ